MAAAPQRIKDLFVAALEQPDPAARRAFLDRECSVDAELRQRLDILMQAHDEPASVLNRPLAEIAPEVPDSGATVEAPPARESAGVVIAGRYKLIEEIGVGGMGAVWMSQQTEPVNRLVALKVIKPGMDSKQVLARFEAERQALALMDHPNIARVLDAGTTVTGGPYFVMELVRGVPITRYCDEHRLTPRQRLELFVPVCQAVQHAHQKGVIHRDLKPANVLVCLYDGRPAPKVIDFGIAKATGQQLTEKTLVTGFGNVIGTLEYMSPEQAELNQLDIDTRSDVYSLGVLLYELLTGTTPLQKQRLKEAALLEVLRRIREEEPPRPSTRLSTTEELPSIAANRGLEPKRLSGLVRGELDWIVMKALEKDRGRRYDSPNSFAQDVQRYLADEPVQACPPSALYRLRKFARRKKTVLAMLACGILALAVMAGAVGWAVRDKGTREEVIKSERLAREEALDQAVERLLDEAGPLRDQQRWPEALAVVERADKLLAAAGRSDRPARLPELRRELSLVLRLEELYQPRAPQSLTRGQPLQDTSQAALQSVDETFFNGREQDARFSQEFRDFGIDLDALLPAEAAARIAATGIRPALVQALDRWAALRVRFTDDISRDPRRQKLIEVARLADGDVWRNRVRAALLRLDRAALVRLAEELPVGEVPPATVWLLGGALLRVGAVDRGLTVFREGQRRHPEDFWLNDSLGSIYKDYLKPPRYDESLRYYSCALALRPHWRLYASVADVLHATGRHDEAIAVLSDAIRLNKNNNPDVWIKLGLAYNNLSQYDKARADFTQAIALDSKNAADWKWRGITYHYLRQYDKAVADLSRAIELDAKDVLALEYRAIAYYHLGQHQKAIADFSRIIELEPTHVTAWYNRGIAHSELGQQEKALADSSRAIELNSKVGSLWFSRGNINFKLRHYDKAIADYSRAIELKPKQPASCEWYYLRGQSYLRLRQYDRAIADLSQTIDLDPRNAIYLNALAWLLATCPDKKRQDPKRAVDLARKAVRLAPKDGNLWNTLGMAHYRAGDWKAAIAAIEKSMEKSKGGIASDWLVLAMAHEKLGNRDEARKRYDQAVQWLEKDGPMLAKSPQVADELRRFRAEAEETLGLKKN
jgi:tetratricopeptide (TPR) repeat protein